MNWKEITLYAICVIGTLGIMEFITLQIIVDTVVGHITLMQPMKSTKAIVVVGLIIFAFYAMFTTLFLLMRRDILNEMYNRKIRNN